MKAQKIIVVGAGISGLALARELCRAGKKVLVLEARNRAGGRIHTLSENEFPLSAETGAEFIHGRLPQTIRLLKNYAIPFSRTSGEIWQLRKGVFSKNEDLVGEHHHLLKRELKKLQEDLPVKEFLALRFPGEEFQTFREAVTHFVEGYDTADSARASTFELRDEWLEAQDWKQYRVDGGYSRLVNALVEECKTLGCEFHFSSEAKKLSWKKDEVAVLCADGKEFSAEQLALTVPLGVLQSGALEFVPALPEKETLIQNLGFGEIIKILLCFEDAFWKRKEIKKRSGHNFRKLLFISSDAIVSNWWTQHPADVPLLTGWLSGPTAQKFKNESDESILQKSIASLAFIFGEKEDDLKNNLRAWKVINWSIDPFTRGSYVYATVGSEKQIEALSEPVEQTLFFAGELFAPEAGIGLVEAAIVSGLKAAKRVLKK